jgi:hypothetical protein
MDGQLLRQDGIAVSPQLIGSQPLWAAPGVVTYYTDMTSDLQTSLKLTLLDVRHFISEPLFNSPRSFHLAWRLDRRAWVYSSVPAVMNSDDLDPELFSWTFDARLPDRITQNFISETVVCTLSFIPPPLPDYLSAS